MRDIYSKLLILVQDVSIEHPSGGKVVLENDPISFAFLFCATAVALTYLVFKIKKLKDKED
jgi:hypothetical protein